MGWAAAQNAPRGGTIAKKAGVRGVGPHANLRAKLGFQKLEISNFSEPASARPMDQPWTRIV